MLDNILSTARGLITKEVSNQSVVPEDKQGAIVDTIMDTLGSKLGGQDGGFDLSSITGLLSGGDSGISNLTSSLNGSMISSLMDKVGLDNPTAQSIVEAVLPKVISFFTKEAGDEKDEGGLRNLLGKIGL